MLGYPDTLGSNNITDTGYGIIQAIQIAGHRTVLKVSDLYNLSIPILSNSKGSIPLDAKFQLWSVCGETDAKLNGLYQLMDFNNRGNANGWRKVDFGEINADGDIIFNQNVIFNENITIAGNKTVTIGCGTDFKWCDQTLNEAEIKKWNQILISVGLNTSNAYYVPATTAQGAYFITGATTVLDATIKLDKAIQTVINSSGFNTDGTYSKPNSGVTGSYVSGSTTVKGALEGLDNHAINVNKSIGLNQNGTMPSFTGNYTAGATNIIDAINKLDTELKRFETASDTKYMPYSGGTFVGGVTATTAAPFVFSGTVTTNNTVTINSGETVNGTITANGTLNFPNTGNNITGKGAAHFEQGGFQDYSDIRLKENIKDLDITLDQIQSLSLIYFNYIGKERENIGVIAQQVKEICPQIIYEDENGMLAVDYKFLSVIALKGVQLLTSKLMEQENDIKQIKELLNLK